MLRISLLPSATLALASASILVGTPAHAQFGGPQSQPATQVHDASALKPPPGISVAIVEFEDMECPSCALANPILLKAVAQYKIPWIRHDFPLPQHPWSMQAAIYARWFDSKDTKVENFGDEYRDYIFSSHNAIATAQDLRAYTETFAKVHKLGPPPFNIDPQGVFAAQIAADKALGQKIGIDHTPTIWVVTSQSKGAPFIEVRNPDSQLYQTIDRAMADTKPSIQPQKTSKTPQKSSKQPQKPATQPSPSQ
jgi:protein-disulfide isomerase